VTGPNSYWPAVERERTYRNALQIRPDHHHKRHFSLELAVSLTAQHKSSEALVEFKAARTPTKQVIDFLMKQGEKNLSAQEYFLAMEYFLAAMSLRPSNHAILQHVVRNYKAQSKIDIVVQMVADAAAVQPHIFDGLLRRLRRGQLP
jgi:hypothetical protein